MKSFLRQSTISLAVVLGLIACMFFYISVNADDTGLSEDDVNALGSELDSLASGGGNIRTRLEETKRKKELIESELMRVGDAVASAEQRKSQYYEGMKTRIKYLYENDDSSFLEILFSAGSMTEFLNKADFIQNISEYDREMLEELYRVYSDIAAKKEALVSLQAAAEALEEELAGKLPHVTLSDGSTISKAAAKVSCDEEQLLAAIIECEAGQDYNAMLAVATVILNRVESPRFANSITDVVYSTNQFAPVVLGSLDAALSRGPSGLSVQVAQDAINGIRLEAVSDCYYFLYAGAVERDGVNVGGNLFFSSW